ncbi:MAG: phospho-N-acetylmuramoyl-pentapeptide-transferase [Flavobacteriaceae bacterium]|nr:phospho-N-acetylmuramoyl-pentapeptide-transferase [Flavobacteriaceae bacterium]MDC0925595.1 phospho-N-acetylmuramoyl-pentapeptide-transferase [Flavobacteriaceae bacterium]PTM07215.1 MAG: phospho-N-acetylmuramoyl-pentapeptide-transferase [Bacteroidota bacterium]
MLYTLFDFLDRMYDLPGASLFRFLSFRAALATVISLLIGIVFGKSVIDFLKRKQIGETIRDLGLEGQTQKAGTPTMGGLIIIGSTLIPVVLFADLTNVYIQLLLLSTLWMGVIGFIDDYIKKFKNDKDGLKGKFKVLGQVILGGVVGAVLYFHPHVTLKKEVEGVLLKDAPEIKAVMTNIPFFKNNELDYTDILTSIDPSLAHLGWLIFIPVVIFIVTAVSNGANLTDGIDGLAAGSSAIIMLALLVMAWVSGNFLFADYLNIFYLPKVGEVVVFSGAFIGALIGFMWYNTYPAQVFMGDTGSLTIGGVIAVIALIVRKELLVPVLCGIFFAESLSVMLQVGYFKYSRKKYGTGRRIFLMAPLHHHYQKKGYHESKIVMRFLIVGILLAVLSIVTLKIR